MHIIQLGAAIEQGNNVRLGNAGDTAISCAFNYMFETEFPNARISFLNCRKIFSQDDIEYVNQADVLFVCGGGLFLHDTFKNNVSDWQWGISKKLLKKITIPIVVYAVGYNKFRRQREFNSLFDDTVTELLRKSIFFSLRNTGSCESIKKHVSNEFHNKISLNFCPTLCLNKKFGFVNSSDTNSVGFIIAGDRLDNRHNDLPKFIAEMGKFVEYLKTKGKKTVLINHQNDFWLKQYIDFDEYIDLFEKECDYIYETYSNIETVVCDRGHGQMIPFSCGCKILTVISHDKLKWFLDDIGLNEFSVDEDDKLLSEKLIDKFTSLENFDWKKIHHERMNMIFDINNKNLKYIKNQIIK